MRYFLTLLIATLFITGCSNCGGTKTADAAREAEQTQSVGEVGEMVDDHNARNSLDYEGVYSGTLAIEGEDELEYVIILNDNNYFKRTKDGNGTLTEKNEYKWNDGGSTITLVGATTPNKFFVGENNLFVADENDKRIKDSEGNFYTLNKITDPVEAIKIMDSTDIE